MFITDRGRPAHVLLTFEAYERLVGKHAVIELLAEPTGVEDIEFAVLTSSDEAEPASFS